VLGAWHEGHGEYCRSTGLNSALHDDLNLRVCRGELHLVEVLNPKRARLLSAAMYTRIVQPGFRPVATTVVAALPGAGVRGKGVLSRGRSEGPALHGDRAGGVGGRAGGIDLPAAPVMANFTVAPRTGRPVWSFTRSTGATGSEAPRRPTCWLPATTLIDVPTVRKMAVGRISDWERKEFPPCIPPRA
jgi:hypothetical protein